MTSGDKRAGRTTSAGITTDRIPDQLIADLARDAVAQIAPQELPLYRALSEAYFKDRKKAVEGYVAKDEMLGFGFPEAVAFATPVILDVLRYIADHVLQTIEAESADAASDTVRQLFKRFRTHETQEQEPHLTSAQIVEVRRLAFEKARKLKLPEAKATLLADSIAGSLVVSA